MGRIWPTYITCPSCIVLVTVILAICSHVWCGKAAHNRTEFPSFFIFGDSVVAAGNNNYIFSLAKANFYPYGVDFNPGGPFKPTGRFCNGRTVVDFIGDHFNLPLIPAYLDPSATGKRILSGVNYASAAAGILPETGLDFIGRRDFEGQLKWFESTTLELKVLIGEANATDLIKNALYTVIIGSNDYLNNYLLLTPPTHINASSSAFQQRLLQTFQDQLTTLYKMGARNIIVSGLGPLGCIPLQLALKSADGNCSEDVNNLALNFNIGMQQMLHQLNANNSDAQFRYANVYDYLTSYIKSPSLHGFQVANESCCGRGYYKAQGGCRSSTPFCPNRTVYVFWDRFHPTQAVNQKLAQAMITDFNMSSYNY